jgi:16S rRNA (cytosine1402-N4)-methyltransferase
LVEDENLWFVNHNYRFLKNYLRLAEIDKVDGILADLGVSTYQFDTAEKGFSFRFDAKLDMRMNKNAAFSAMELINNYEEAALSKIFWEYGELSNSRKIASLIVRKRQTEKIETTTQLVDTISVCLPKNQEHKFLAKVFQAIRIEVNAEMQSLIEVLNQTAELIKENGRLVVITYHSLEDRIVKNFVKSGNVEGKIEKDFYGNVKTPFVALTNKIIVPSEEEIEKNNRARSAKLRIAVRTEHNVAI